MPTTDREEAFFAAALEKPTRAERAAYLEGACGGDRALLARLEALLAAHDGSGGVLDAPPSALTPTAAYRPLTEGPGTKIGPYKLLQQIGEGGMGVVYMAEQEQPVRRKVALKIIKPGMDSQQVIARFEAERQALAMMDHQNIARVLDAGTTESGRPYFVMELVHGVPITQFCDDNKLTTRERLALFVPVCQAIQHAHQKGIIHRDVKPSNVLVTMYDDKPVPKVIDFGVAKATEQRLTERSMFTQFGALVGTFEYMSPEQAEMNAFGVDTRSDIYSLGVLLYELLTGTTPLERTRLRSAALDEMVRLIKEEEAPRPSVRLSSSTNLPTIAAVRKTEPARLSKLVRGEIDWIVMKCLEKDRSRRYETANGLAHDIQNHLADEPVEACPPTAWYKLRKFTRKHRKALAVGAAFAGLLLLGVVFTTWQAVRARMAEQQARMAEQQAHEAAGVARNAEGEAAAERDKAVMAESAVKEQRDQAVAAEKKAVAEKARADEEAAVAKAVNDFLRNDLLAEASPGKNAHVNKVTLEEVLGRAAARIAGKFETQPLIEAAIRQTIGDTYRELGEYTAAQPHLERAVEIRRRVLGEEHYDTLTSMNNLGALYMYQGQYAKAEPLYFKNLAARRHALGEQHPDTLTSMNNLAGLYLARGQFAKAEALFVKALEVQRRVLGEEHPDTLISMNSLAGLYQTEGQFAKAEPLCVKVLELQRRVLGEAHPDTLRSMNNLAALFQNQGQPTKAEPLYIKTLEIRRRVLGEEHPDTLVSMNNLATLYGSSQKFDLAIPLFAAALKIQKARLGPDHPDTLRTMANLGVTYRDAGQLKDAVPLLEDANRRIQALPPANQHSLTWVRGALADAYARAGQPVKGATLLREQMGLVKQAAGSAPAYADALAQLGQNLLKQQKWVEAEPILRESLAIREKKEADAWKTFRTKSELGGALLGQKKYAEAEPLLLAGYEGMKERVARIPPILQAYVAEALERLVLLYEAMGKKDKAAEWRKKLEEFKGSAKPPAKP